MRHAVKNGIVEGYVKELFKVNVRGCLKGIIEGTVEDTVKANVNDCLK